MKRLIIFSAIFISAILVALFLFGNGRVDAVKPTRGKAVKAVYASGLVEAEVMLPISSKFTAKLIELDVDENAVVKKGQQLANLGAMEQQYDIQDLRAKEEYARIELERNRILYSKEAIAKEALDKAASDYSSAKALRLSAETQTDYNNLYAPADGIIIKRDGEVGQLIPANQPIFWFAANSDLRVTADVDEEDIAAVKPGQKVLIQADSFPDKIFQGQLQSITQKGDPIARTFRARIKFIDAAPFMIGMNVETNIIISESDNALLIPSNAVVQNYVWTVEDGTLKKTPIKFGAKGLDTTEVLEGLTDDSIVVINPAKNLVAGKKVRPRIK